MANNLVNLFKRVKIKNKFFCEGTKGTTSSKKQLNFTFSTFTHAPMAIGSVKRECLFGSYLAGLIEGDGYISINNKNRVIIGITFNLKDKPFAVKLLGMIGKGFIAKRKTSSIELRFSSKVSLCRIITLINGKFRTPKIDQLFKLID
jgi:hypothetical protein